MTRRLKDNTIVEELDEPVQLIVYTKVPSKYKLVDLETGQEYIGQNKETSDNNMYWKMINGTNKISK